MEMIDSIVFKWQCGEKIYMFAIEGDVLDYPFNDPGYWHDLKEKTLDGFTGTVYIRVRNLEANTSKIVEFNGDIVSQRDPWGKYIVLSELRRNRDGLYLCPGEDVYPDPFPPIPWKQVEESCMETEGKR